jgi:chemotaxis protein MotB
LEQKKGPGMKNMDSLPLVKEQLKVKTFQLRKVTIEKKQLAEKFGVLKVTNLKEIKTLKESIEKKNNEIKKHRSRVSTVRMTPHDPKFNKNNFLFKLKLPDEWNPELKPPTEAFLEKNVQDLQDQFRSLRDQIFQEKDRVQKLQKDRDLLVKELKRLRVNAEKDKVLKEQVFDLRAKLLDSRARSRETIAEQNKLIQGKDHLIEKYEKILYGDQPSKDKLPSEIIADLKKQLEILKKEKSQLTLELETVMEDYVEMESRLTQLEENHERPKNHSSFHSNSESRAAVTAEFSAGLENFLITYSDMITLLLVIFVFLYTMSKIDDERFAEAISSFQEREHRVEKYNVHLNQKELDMLARVRELVKDNVSPEAIVRSDVRTILVRLRSSDLFDPGSADLVPGAEEQILSEIKENLREGVKQVMVDGHTDNVPINSAQYPSNWELSTARASRVARVIIEKMSFPPERMVVTGYGQFRPWKSNNSDENRGLNRRVEIKILKDIDVAKQESKYSTPGNGKEKALSLK